MRTLVVTLPSVRLEQDYDLCRCGLYIDAGEHEPASECRGREGKGCHDPSAHHPYRAISWWHRVRVARRSW